MIVKEKYKLILYSLLCKFNITNAYYKASARTQTQHNITEILKNAIPNKQYKENVTATEKQRYELTLRLPN
jgi:hypothetical protein